VNQNIAYAICELPWHLFANHGDGAIFNGLADVQESIYLRAWNGYKQAEGSCFSAVKSQVFNRNVRIALDFFDPRTVEDFFQEFHALQDNSRVMA